MNSVVMPIEHVTFKLSSLLPPPSPSDVDPGASWPMQQPVDDFDEYLLTLCRLPAGAGASPFEAREAERLYDLASPIKPLLEESPYRHPMELNLRDRLRTISSAVRDGHLPVEHARRLLVPSEPSWLTSLNTLRRVELAHDTLQTLTRASVLSDGTATAASQSLLRGLLETEGNSPSEVLLSMDLFDKVAWLPPLDGQRAILASRMVDFMYQMQFTEAEIGQISTVPRKKAPPFPLASQPA